MVRSAVLLAAFCSLCAVHGQMILQGGTAMTVDVGTALRVNAPVSWSIESGADLVNNGVIELGPEADLTEAPDAAISGTGTERTTRELQTPLTGEDPGGLGAIITTNASLGTTLIVRGHVPFTDYSGHSSIARWIDLSPSNNTGLNAALAFRYAVAELNGLTESEQRVHIRAQQDIWWYLPGVVNIGNRTVTTTGLDSLGLFTTFDEDLPNGLHAAEVATSFALVGSPGEQLYLRVPRAERVGTWTITTMSGARIAGGAPGWGEGLHPLPMIDAAPGPYLLRVNGKITFTFLQP